MSLFDELKALADNSKGAAKKEAACELSETDMEAAAQALATEMYESLVHDLRQNVTNGKFSTIKGQRAAKSLLRVHELGNYDSLDGQHMPTYKSILGEADQIFTMENVMRSKFFSSYASFYTKTTPLGKLLVDKIQTKAKEDGITLEVYYTCSVGDTDQVTQYDYPEFTSLDYSGYAKRISVLHLEATMVLE